MVIPSELTEKISNPTYEAKLQKDGETMATIAKEIAENHRKKHQASTGFTHWANVELVRGFIGATAKVHYKDAQEQRRYYQVALKYGVNWTRIILWVVGLGTFTAFLLNELKPFG